MTENSDTTTSREGRRGVDAWPEVWARNSLDIRLFDSPFVADSGGEELDDGLLG